MDSRTKYAAYAAIVCVFFDAINLQCCAPNYPLMVTPGIPQSFPSTAPFDTASSKYVIPGATRIATVLSNLMCGYLSGKGKIGARNTLQILMLGSALLTVAKYFARGSFWAFTVLCFANGKIRSAKHQL